MGREKGRRAGQRCGAKMERALRTEPCARARTPVTARGLGRVTSLEGFVVDSAEPLRTI